MSEYRIVLTNEEAFELSKKLKVVGIDYVKDEYTGTKRIRTDLKGVREKEYITSVSGTTFRTSLHCELGDIKNIWFESKWTKDTARFEIEFEDKILEEFKGRPSIKGWDILTT